MALYKCPECGHEVSTSARRCPHCGKDLRCAGAVPRWRALSTGKKIALVVVLALVFAGIVADIAGDGSKRTPASESAAASVPAVPDAAQKAAPSAPTDGSGTIQAGDWFGFATKDLMTKSSKLAAQGDREAWAKLMTQAAAAGALTKFKAGETVYVEDTALLSGMVKVRRKGETEGWWTNAEAIRTKS